MAAEPKDIIVELLRHRISDPRGRHSSTSDSFNGDANTKTFTLTPTSGYSVQCITAVTVDGVAQSKWQDYTFDPMFQSKVVTFVTAPGSGTGNVVVTYDEGTTDWIYPDLAKISLSSSSYPRMNVMLVSGSGARSGSETSSPSVMIDTEHYQIDIWVKEDYKYTISASEIYTGARLAVYFARQIKSAFENYIDDIYPKLSNYNLLNIKDAVWEDDRQIYHVIVEIELSGESLGVN